MWICLRKWYLKRFLGYNESIIHCTSNHRNTCRKLSHKAYFGIWFYYLFFTLLVHKTTENSNDYRPSWIWQINRATRSRWNLEFQGHPCTFTHNDNSLNVHVHVTNNVILNVTQNCNIVEIFVCLFVCLFGVFRPTQEFFTHMYTSPLPVKDFKFWTVLGTHGHWTVRVL